VRHERPRSPIRIHHSPARRPAVLGARHYTEPVAAPANPRGLVASVEWILPLRGVIQSYAWGSGTALAALLGRPLPTSEPEAELWLGAHPRGPAEVELEGRLVPLPELIARDPETVLGATSVTRFGPRLPFLLKVLAVEQPLSLQVHPDAERARAGFANEEALGIPLDAPQRRYPDASDKPELVYALGPFQALAGFRPPAEIRARVARLGLEGLVPDSAPSQEAALEDFFCSWFEADPVRRDDWLAAAAAAARRDADADPASAWIERLARGHPGDPGALAPAFLHLVALEAGQALFLPPGELHTYLEGVAVELMASSDNVLRCALTAKFVDLAEARSVLRFRSQLPCVLEPLRRAPGECLFETRAEAFSLSLLEPALDAPAHVTDRRGFEILLCLEGSARVSAPGDDSGIVIERGGSCAVLAAAGRYRVEGPARLVRAALPAAAFAERLHPA
jgi:mannose-6-phosphate isomerase